MADNEARTNIRVCVRFRPQNALERQHMSTRCIALDESNTAVSLLDGQNQRQSFSFDRVFAEAATQDEVYKYVAHPLVEEVIGGYNCTIFAYGQTGSGKTHTMMGQADNFVEHGVIPRIIRDMFDIILQSPETVEFTVKASYLELYLERIQDLLNPAGTNLRVREDPKKGIYVEGMTEVYVGSTEEMLQLMAKGSTNRAIASTKMNQESSRSHSIFGIEVERHDLSSGRKTVGKMYLVDLAGSEMVGKTQATGQTLQEAKMINRSLSSLGNVIKALTDGAEHVPYRDSKLTRVLQDSLGGNAKTSLIVTASSSSYNITETLSTLRFGTRAKRIKNRPKVNQERSIEEYKALLEDSARREAEFNKAIKRLQAEISRLRSGRGEDAATDAADIRNEDLDEIDEQLTAALSSCGVKIESPPATAGSRLDRIHELIRVQTDAYQQLKFDFEAMRDLADEREIQLEELREREAETVKELELANQKWQEIILEKEERDAKMAEAEVARRRNDFVRKENRLLVSQLADDLDILMRGHQYGLDMDISSFEPRCRATLRRLEAVFSRDTPDVSDDESETGTQVSDMASVDGDLNMTPVASHRKKKRQTRREMELESDVQTLTARMVELRTQLEAERENVAQLYETIDSEGGKQQLSSKLAEETLQLRQALDRKSQQHQQLSLMFQNSEAACKKMQQRINNREEQIQNLEHSLAEFQQTHRRTVEELTDRLQLYEAQLKALAISDAPPMSRARLVKSIRGSQRLLASDIIHSGSQSDELSPTSPNSKQPFFAEEPPSSSPTGGEVTDRLTLLQERLRQADTNQKRSIAAKSSPVRAANSQPRAAKPVRASPGPARRDLSSNSSTPTKGPRQRSPTRVPRDGSTPVVVSPSTTSESSPQPAQQSETFVSRALRSLSASRGGRADNTKGEDDSGGILGTLRRRTSFRSSSSDTTPDTPEPANQTQAEVGVMSIFRRRPSFTQTNGEA